MTKKTKAKTLSNTMTPDQLVQQIDALSSARTAWENGTYKASNDELYALLDRCRVLLLEVQADRQLSMQIGKLIAERGLGGRSNTSLAVKIVRLVFGDCGKRAFIYAKVITVAAIEMRPNQSMATFITDGRGVENISRNNPIAAANPASRQDNINLAATELSSAKAIAPLPAVAKGIPCDKDADGYFALALIRRDKDGTDKVVFRINNMTVVNSALAAAGKILRSQIEADSKVNRHSGHELQEADLIVQPMPAPTLRLAKKNKSSAVRKPIASNLAGMAA